MAKSKPRKKKGSSPCNSKKDTYTKVAKRLNELCQMVDCTIMQQINTMEHFSSMAKYHIRLGNVSKIISPFAANEYKARYSRYIKHICKIEMIAIDGLHQQVSFNDIITLFKLQMYLSYTSHIDKPLAEKALEQIKVFLPKKDTIYIHLAMVLRRLYLFENLPDELIVSFDFDTDFAANNRCLCTINFTLIIQKPEIEHVLINGHKRPVFQWFFPIEHQNTKHFSTVPSEQLEHLYKGPDKNIHIYFQSHAIKRFKERLASINECAQKDAFNCFMLKLPQAFIKGHKLFLPFIFDDIKVGYFIAELIHNKLVVKTFILITHASAPEGSQFQALTGFEKNDMTYWNISKLDTFIYNTMSADNPLYTYFEQSELLHLFDLNEKFVSREDIHKVDAHWDGMIKCLNKYYQNDTLSNAELKEVQYEHMLSG